MGTWRHFPRAMATYKNEVLQNFKGYVMTDEVQLEKVEWSGVTSSYLHKWHPEKPNEPDTALGVRKVWLLDAQWSTCPVEVENQVKDLWRWAELGNDQYMYKTTIDGLIELQAMEEKIEQWSGSKWVKATLKTNAIIQYLREMGVGENEKVIIHWWW